ENAAPAVVFLWSALRQRHPRAGVVLEQPRHELLMEDSRVGDAVPKALEYVEVARTRVHVESLAEHPHVFDVRADHVFGIHGAVLRDVALEMEVPVLV